MTFDLHKLYHNAHSSTASALVASTACFPLWLKICHRHIFLTRRAHTEGAFGLQAPNARKPIFCRAVPWCRRCLKQNLSLRRETSPRPTVRNDVFFKIEKSGRSKPLSYEKS